ncbi:Hypothetical protein, putative [Bodo saltans]|uniref:Membrane-associated protein n=1 Tax=Bodo saltans TaxID=75058 RepID=A0A0S4J3A0_BODSA|nr:Hypothetical protein, putative [Bodo saltans]|eukprot:CUG85801.1 Hypothetical protein, putative [Bodo saltans]
MLQRSSAASTWEIVVSVVFFFCTTIITAESVSCANDDIQLQSNRVYRLVNCQKTLTLHANITLNEYVISNVTIIVEGSNTSALPTLKTCSLSWESIRILIVGVRIATTTCTTLIPSSNSLSQLHQFVIEIKDSVIQLHPSSNCVWLLQCLSAKNITNVSISLVNSSLDLRNVALVDLSPSFASEVRNISIHLSDVILLVVYDPNMVTGRTGFVQVKNVVTYSAVSMTIRNATISVVMNTTDIYQPLPVWWSLLHLEVVNTGENCALSMLNTTFNFTQLQQDRSLVINNTVVSLSGLFLLLDFVSSTSTMTQFNFDARSCRIVGRTNAIVQLMYASGSGTVQPNMSPLLSFHSRIDSVKAEIHNVGALPQQNCERRASLLAFEKCAIAGSNISVTNSQLAVTMDLGDGARAHTGDYTLLYYAVWLLRTQLVYIHNSVVQGSNISISYSSVDFRNSDGVMLTVSPFSLGVAQGFACLFFVELASFTVVVLNGSNIVVQQSTVNASVRLEFRAVVSV